MVIIYALCTGLAIADREIDDWFESVKCYSAVYISTGMQLMRLRLGVKMGDIKPFQLYSPDAVTSCDTDGRMTEVIPEFDRVFEELLLKLM